MSAGDRKIWKMRSDVGRKGEGERRGKERNTGEKEEMGEGETRKMRMREGGELRREKKE